MTDIIDRYNSARLTPAPAQMMKDAIDEIVRLRAENEKLRRDVKTAVMGDSAELADVKRENEKLREAVAAERERCAKIAEQGRDDTCDGPVAWSMADCIAAAIRESGE